MMQMMQNWKAKLLEFFTLFSERNLLGLSASIGFYLVLSLTPFLLLMFALTAVLGWENSTEFRTAVAESLGSSAAIGLDAISQRLDADKSGGLSFGILGLIAILFSSSGVVGEIRDALNRVILTVASGSDAAATSAAAETERLQAQDESTWGAVRTWAWGRAFAILAVVTCVLVAIASFAVGLALRWLIPADENFWRNIQVVASFAVFAGLFYAMFRWLPSRQPRPGFASSAALICSALFHVGNRGLEIYFANSAIKNSYGALAGFIILLLWAQYNGLIVLVSAVAAQVFFTNKSKAADADRPVVAPKTQPGAVESPRVRPAPVLPSPTTVTSSATRSASDPRKSFEERELHP